MASIYEMFHDVIDCLCVPQITGNKLSINMSKSNTMLVSNSIKYSKLDIILNGVALQQVESTKYLGVYVDSHLKWNEHILHLSKIVNQKLYVLSKLRLSLPSEALKIIYVACIQSLLDYCGTVWMSVVQLANTKPRALKTGKPG